MTCRDRVLGECREAIGAAAATNRGTWIALVGSVARGDDSPDSDCDFLVAFENGASLFDLAHLQLELASILGRDVDVTSTGSLDPEHAGLLADAVNL